MMSPTAGPAMLALRVLFSNKILAGNRNSVLCSATATVPQFRANPNAQIGSAVVERPGFSLPRRRAAPITGTHVSRAFATASHRNETADPGGELDDIVATRGSVSRSEPSCSQGAANCAEGSLALEVAAVKSPVGEAREAYLNGHGLAYRERESPR